MEDLHHGRLDAAEKSLGELLVHAPGDADILNLLAATAARQGRPETTISLLEQAIVSNPGNIDSRYNLGTHYLSLFRYEEAVAVLNEVLAIDARHATAAFNLGKSLKALGRQEEAARAFLQAMQNQPGYTKAMSERADSLIETGDFVSAGDLLQKSVAAHPDDVDLQFTRGRLMLWQRDWKAAIEAFDAALSISPWHALSAAFKGIALREADQDIDAAAVDGLDRLVDVPVFSQMFPQSLNDGLIDAVTTHPSLFCERPNNSTIGGGQTGNLVNDPGDVVARFVGA